MLGVCLPAVSCHLAKRSTVVRVQIPLKILGSLDHLPRAHRLPSWGKSYWPLGIFCEFRGDKTSDRQLGLDKYFCENHSLGRLKCPFLLSTHASLCSFKHEENLLTSSSPILLTMADIESAAIRESKLKAATEAAIQKDPILTTTSSLPSSKPSSSPTAADLATLRRIPDKIPWSVLTIAFVELCERFSYYGTTAVFTNFIQWPLPPGSTTGANYGTGQAGAMGFGQRASTGLTTFNAFWQYTMPLFGAYIADSYLGRYRTICWALVVGIVGHVVLVVAAIPPVIKNPPGAMAAFILGIITMGIGTGGFKPNINPLIIEQLPAEEMRVEVLKSGERVIVDPAVTASRVYHYFYLFINIGALVGQIGMVVSTHSSAYLSHRHTC